MDIITMQAINWAFVFKNNLNGIQSRKAKRLEQLKIIAVIMNNNLQSEATITVKKVELDCLYTKPTNSSNAVKKAPFCQATACLQTSICTPAGQAQEIQEKLDTNDEETFLQVIMIQLQGGWESSLEGQRVNVNEGGERSTLREGARIIVDAKVREYL